jgi:acylphosphatase
MNEAVRFAVSGKVQGVFFRASTCAEAQRLGLCGYAKNLADGRVEVVVSGNTNAIEELAQWLEHGPPQARVDVLERHDAGDFSSEGFSIG